MSQRNLSVPRKRNRRIKLDGQNRPIIFHPEGLEQLDKRYSFTRKMLKIYRQLKRESKSDSLAKDQLCRRAAFLSIQVESLECKALRDDPSFEPGQLVLATNSLIAILRTLGLEDRSKIKTKTLHEYVRDFDDDNKDPSPRRFGALNNGLKNHSRSAKLKRYSRS